MSRAPNPGPESRKNFPFPASRRAWGLRAADFSDPGNRVRSDVLSHLFLEMKNGRVYIHLGCVLTVVVGLGARLRQAFFLFVWVFVYFFFFFFFFFWFLGRGRSVSRSAWFPSFFR